MRGSQVLVLALIVSLAGLSGCVGAKAKSTRVDPYIQPVGFNDETGSVIGTVVDDEFQPLRDAIVGFIDPYQATKTDEAGYFEIGLLKPGDRNLYVIHLGHQADGKRITIKLREATEVLFILPVLPIEEPWIDIVQRTGRFAQAVKIDPVNAAVNSTSHEWRIRDKPNALDALHMDVIWSQNSGLSGGLRVTFGLGASATRWTFFTLEGKSPLEGSVDRAGIEDVWTEQRSVCIKDPCRLRWSATPATKTTNLAVDFGIMVEQTFDVYVSHFYRQPMPQGYVAPY